jgi:two-component system aerobic respiration control sensor histidine kinase ArcB
MNDEYSGFLLGPDSALSSSAGVTQKRQILLVDDDEITRNVVGRMVSQVHDVVVYASPKEAKEAFVPGTFDVALIDLGMTQMPGDVLEAQLRQEDPALVTVLITGWLLEEGDERAAGFDFCIHKPVEMGALLQVIEDAIILYDQRVAEK